MSKKPSRAATPQSKLSDAEILKLQQEQIKLLQAQLEFEQGLPHLYGFKWYRWAKEFFESRHKENFLCAANQISKSSTQIRKAIHWATSPNMWKELWPSLLPNQAPATFWYFYPTFDVAQAEFESKWEPLFLPRGKFRDSDPVYGWRAEFDKNQIRKIVFNSGVTIYFKAYSQKPKDLQTGTVYALFLDEEMPVEILPEIQARLNATDGYFHMVFTATLGQVYWEQTIEPKSPSDEKHRGAWKRQISIYDCLTYEDGSPTHWTLDKIKRAEAKCPNDAEVQRRIFGRFVRSSGLQYESFSLERNVCDPHTLPSTWNVYSAVDPGSGGMSGHPAAIVFVSVSPDYKRGRVFRGWRGDNIPTTAEDVLLKHAELREKMQPIQQRYDYAAKDFFTIASRKGESWIPADKGRDSGIGLLNTLFKTGMLKIHRGDPELEKLIAELCSLPVGIDKKKAKDDLCDALRYAVTAVPWDFSDIEVSSESEALKEIPPKREKTGPEQRREWFMSQTEEVDSIQAELDFWNEESGAL